jgi:hypothetical protein
MVKQPDYLAGEGTSMYRHEVRTQKFPDNEVLGISRCETQATIAARTRGTPPLDSLLLHTEQLLNALRDCDVLCQGPEAIKIQNK